MFKMAWARLCVFGRMHDRVHVSDVCTTECTFSDGRGSGSMHGRVNVSDGVRLDGSWCKAWSSGRTASDVCTAECTFRTGARLGGSWHTTRTGAGLGCSWCTAWSGRVWAWTRPRLGRDTRIVCARAKLYG